MEKKRWVEIVLAVVLLIVIVLLATQSQQRKEGVGGEAPDSGTGEEDKIQKEVGERMYETTEIVLGDVDMYVCVALSTQNISICESSTDTADCKHDYYLFRSILFNEDLCENAGLMADLCNGIISQGESYCDNYEGDCQRYILLRKSVENKDEGACSSLIFDDYAKCVSLIKDEPEFCIAAKSVAAAALTEEVCDSRFDSLSMMGKSYCEKYHP